ncbi:MAG: DUF2231 domain-containing protein [Halothece sp.]
MTGIQEKEQTGTPYPNIPPVLESRESEYQDKGVVSSIAIAGHPIHPIIVIMPIALLLLAAGSDVGYLTTHDFFWARASIWLIGLGLASGILAGLVGMFDFLRIKRVRQRTAGWAHMYINITALVVTAINFGLRLDGIAEAIIPIGVSLSLFVAILLGVGGWYGGELTFRHKVGVIGPSSQEE